MSQDCSGNTLNPNVTDKIAHISSKGFSLDAFHVPPAQKRGSISLWIHADKVSVSNSTNR